MGFILFYSVLRNVLVLSLFFLFMLVFVDIITFEEHLENSEIVVIIMFGQ